MYHMYHISPVTKIEIYLQFKNQITSRSNELTELKISWRYVTNAQFN